MAARASEIPTARRSLWRRLRSPTTLGLAGALAALLVIVLVASSPSQDGPAPELRPHAREVIPDDNPFAEMGDEELDDGPTLADGTWLDDNDLDLGLDLLHAPLSDLDDEALLEVYDELLGKNG